MAKLFSDREIRAIAVFLPLAGLLIIALMLVRPAADPEAARRAEAEMEEALPADSVVMSHFDPNTASFDDLRRLGLTKHEAVSLIVQLLFYRENLLAVKKRILRGIFGRKSC